MQFRIIIPLTPLCATRLCMSRIFVYSRFLFTIRSSKVSNVSNRLSKHTPNISCAPRNVSSGMLGCNCNIFMHSYHSTVSNCALNLTLFIFCFHSYQVTAHEREVPVLDEFYKQILDLLWPRMVFVCTANTASIRNCEVDKLGKLDLRKVVFKYNQCTLEFTIKY